MIALGCLLYENGGTWRRESFICNVLEKPSIMICMFGCTETILCTKNNMQFKNFSVSAKSITYQLCDSGANPLFSMRF